LDRFDPQRENANSAPIWHLNVFDAATKRRAIAREVTSVSGRAIMKKASDSERILFTIPVDVTAWLRERAKYHGSTLGAEVTMSLRARMEKDSTKARKPAAAPE
jgi:hypothetical protein